MFTLDYSIQIGEHTLKGIESVSIQSSADMLSDTCLISLPGTAYNKPYDWQRILKRGQSVTVQLGYDGNLRTEFTGYLRRIGSSDPVQLECEDAAYLFRKPMPDKVWKKVTTKEVAQWTLEQINKLLPKEQQLHLVTDEAAGITFDKFSIIRANGYQVLEKLKSESGCALYCRGNALHVHLAYTEKRGEVVYSFQKNIESTSDLVYVEKDDQQLQITVVGRPIKGKRNTVTVGDKGGDKRTILRPTVSDEKSLGRIAKQEQDRLTSQAIYRGTIHSWLLPVCEIGYSVRVMDDDYPARSSTHYASGVKVDFSRSGGRRTITLGIALSDNGQTS